jgi:hypothetical protein
MPRFYAIPSKLRDAATRLCRPVTDGQFLAITGLMEDAALKIEALDREVDRLNSITARES